MPHGGGGIPVVSNILHGLGSAVGVIPPPHMGTPKGPPPTPAAVKGPVDLTSQQLHANALKYGATAAPAFLGMSQAMTPLQQQAAIASGGVSSNDPRYRDPETARYYSSLLYNNPNGDLSDIDKQYIASLGEKPLAETMPSYQSALERSISKM